MKWEPVALMVVLLALGAWLALGPKVPQTPRPGAELTKFMLGSIKGELERVKEKEGESYSFRILYRDGTTRDRLTDDEVRAFFGPEVYRQIISDEGGPLFRAFNVTTWLGVAWVVLGFAGQLAFSGRWLIQWFQSERKRESVVPAAFWWFSLAGSIMLFAYFVWRQDVVGVMGQTTGVVIYARNLRLLRKQARRQAAQGAVPDNR